MYPSLKFLSLCLSLLLIYWVGARLQEKLSESIRLVKGWRLNGLRKQVSTSKCTHQQLIETIKRMMWCLRLRSTGQEKSRENETKIKPSGRIGVLGTKRRKKNRTNLCWNMWINKIYNSDRHWMKNFFSFAFSFLFFKGGDP